MIKPAKLVESKLQETLQRHAFEDRLKYFFEGREHMEIDVRKNTWHRIQAVSLSPRGDVLGLFSANVDRQRHGVDNIGAIRFSPSPSTVFARDLYRFVGALFKKWHFRKVKWDASAENPATEMYKRAVEHYGGRVVGRLRDDKALPDGTVTDALLFEIHQDDINE